MRHGSELLFRSLQQFRAKLDGRIGEIGAMQVAGKRFRIEGGSGEQMPSARGYRWTTQPETPDSCGHDARRQPPPSQLRHLQGELHAMKDAIAMTKREIASLQRSASGGEGMHRAACQLDAAADATERATTTILGAVEEIETAANMLRAAGLGSGRPDHVGTILDRVVLLYETCNFQDLTGQRIEKVVDTMKFVEQRLDALISAWGGSGSQPDGPATPAEDASGRQLATGPSLPGEAQVSQTEVDAFFA